MLEPENNSGGPTGHSPFPDYFPNPGQRDEAFSNGQIHPAWEAIFESCHRHGGGVLGEWQRETLRLSRERGLAYHTQISGSDWELDPIPWVLPSIEWSTIEAGIAQRTRLYDAILRDLYGEQRALKQGWIPPELILGHPGFIRSLHGSLQLTRSASLGISALDLARTSDGTWVVVNDRFDHPYGLGVALENRTVVNQVLPNLFRRCQVRRIGHFFTDWFNYLADSAGPITNHPRLVLLDSNLDGSAESNFLSNYCGIPHVTSSDLTVRDGSVWLKALSGLEPVHSIWKSDSGLTLDSLGTERGMFGGVPGAFEAMRLGNVAIAAHPGTPVIETPGLYPYTDRLCREFLGEDLILSSVRTWWGGDPESLAYLLDHLPDLVIKKVSLGPEFNTHYGRLSSEESLQSLRETIERNPAHFVGQEELTISTVPTSDESSLVPRSAVLRAFAFLDQSQSPRVMPGGLGRVSNKEGQIVSTRQGGISKDVWIRSDLPEAPISIAREVEKSKIRIQEVITSRSGENLFWAGRYGERSDFVSRFAFRLIESSFIGFSYERELEQEHDTVMLKGLFDIFELSSWIDGRDVDSQIQLLLRDDECPVSIPANLNKFNRACLAARDEWSPRSLHAVQKVREEWFAGTGALDSSYQFRFRLERLELNLAAFVGMNLDSMTRDAGWALLDSGRAIERGVMLTGLIELLLRNESEGPAETLLCESILVTTDSLRTYQSRFNTVPLSAQTMELLLGEVDYPRSMLFLVKRMKMTLAKLPGDQARERVLSSLEQIERDLGQFLDDLAQHEIDYWNWRNSALLPLEAISSRFKDLSDELTKSYFSHATN